MSTTPSSSTRGERLALDRQLPDRPRLALLRVHVDVGARDVEVAAEQHRRAGLPPRAANSRSASRNRIFASKSLPPLGT